MQRLLEREHELGIAYHLSKCAFSWLQAWAGGSWQGIMPLARCCACCILDGSGSYKALVVSSMVPCGVWGLLWLPVRCVGALLPDNACQSCCSGAFVARRLFLLGWLENGHQGIFFAVPRLVWWTELVRHLTW